MIIYESNVRDFLSISKTPKKLVAEISGNLINKFGIRVAPNEERSWENSLVHVASLINEYEHDNRIVLIEFNIPTSKQRIDFVILGMTKDSKPSALILELKQWSKVTELEWNNFRVGKYSDTHPSDQARKYEERLMGEMGMDGIVDIKSCAFLHNLSNEKSPLFNHKYDDMLKAAYLYSQLTKSKLQQLIEEHTIGKNGRKAFELFRDAKWKPSLRFEEILNNEFKNINLVGTQKEIYEKIENFVKHWDKKEKMTFLISGAPGSGKTIIAFKLMLLLARELKLKIQLMIPGQEVRDTFKFIQRKNKSVMYSWISGANLWNDHEAAIIDEAHKAIGRDTGVINYQNNYKKLKFAIIFIDDDQVINRKGITKEKIKEIAIKNGHHVYEHDIDENFRNSGERFLLDWIDHIFYRKKTKNREFVYSQEKYKNKISNYKLFAYENVAKFVDSYYRYFEMKDNVRMTSLWHSEFYSGPALQNGDIPQTVPIG